ncbi:hypothetical protein [Massilia sp. SYSU DXS3249]
MLTGYYFAVRNVRIDNTRSLDEDANYFLSSVTVGDRSFPPFFASMGDVREGDYDVGAIIGPLPIEDDGVKISFNYQIVNAGHSDPSAVQKGMVEIADQLAKKLWETAAATGNLWAAGAAAVITLTTKVLLPLLTADCDGMVALDQLSLTGAQLLARTKSGWSETRHYPGTDTPAGCGSNSDYKVSFDVYRSGWSGWLPIPGIETDTSPAVTFFKNKFHVFVKGTDARIYLNKSSDAIHWEGWQEVPGGGRTEAAPAVASSPSKLWLVVKGQTDDRLYLTYYENDAWAEWSEVGGRGSANSAPAAAFHDAGGFLGGRLSIFCRGLNNEIFYNSIDVAPPPRPRGPAGGSVPDNIPDDVLEIHDAKKFKAWQLLPGAGITDQAPAAVVADGLCVLVKGFGEASSFFLRHRGADWNAGWTKVPFVAPDRSGEVTTAIGTTTPQAAVLGGRWYVFAGNSDNDISFNGMGSDNTWFVLPGRAKGYGVKSTVAPAVFGKDKQIQVFVTGTDQVLYVNAWNGTGFPVT